ncbi:hemolysin III family protein [Staphylococcus sp. 18_1_E_LY]|uniref:Hemolysin III family protein n=1 Tax=Staphylococcus lloydii TaxID=2781774 RepID=A0A7T1B179_9STAP|nr:hemolysin III family protein [Staphylococcus lloydii]MBF7020522.1 hemolysin III family protein [Staphylococcus lloydii]MBF7028205.1 hemolysin III family protein [Staphylococcus lloydii]MDU9418137.1 hemolysin III family protein [Staphylococcus lloydii]QPM75867.1 hemolysin III family protein [Staphylococcus lloydii]
MNESTNDKHDHKIMETFKDIIPLSFGEEIGNAASHGLAAFLTLCVLPYAAVRSYIHGDALLAFSVSVFVISIFLMFISSTVYHAMANNSAHKYIMRIIDHSMIYVAITGTYTPICLSLIGGWIGWTAMIVLWGITIWGILYKSLAKQVNHKLSLIMYLVMGWIGIIFVPTIITHTSITFMLFILFGGIAYTIGAWFYAQKNKPYFHMIWHIFIVLASVFHFVGIVYFM